MKASPIQFVTMFEGAVTDVVDSQDKERQGESALHIAIVYRDINTVRMLVENGVNVNQRATGKFFLPEDQKKGRTNKTNYDGYAYYGEYPLAFAACFGCEEIYDYLIRHGADPNLQDSFGNTVLHMLVISNQIRMLALAVKHHVKKADIEIKNQQNLTPLMLASLLGRNEMFKEIIELQSIEIWRYSNVSCSKYPLGPLDTIDQDGRINWSSALLYIIEGETLAHLEMLEGGVIKELLENKWKVYGRRRFTERFVMGILHLLLLSIAIYLRPDSDSARPTEWSAQNIIRSLAEGIVCLNSLVNLIFQFAELRSQGLLGFMKNQKGAPAKLVFNVSCMLILLCVPMRLIGLDGMEVVLLSLAAPCAWMFLLFFARGIGMFGPFVIMIYKMCASDVLRFVIIFLVFLLQFSESFYFLFKDIDNSSIDTFKTVQGSMMQVIHMTLGEFKYDEFNYTRAPGLAKAVFILFAFMVPILLLNMLIAMMGNTYQQISTRSEKEWKRQWAKIILILERSFSSKDLQQFQSCYSVPMESADGPVGLMAIKTSNKTKARQRKGAIANWKRTVNNVKALNREGRGLSRRHESNSAIPVLDGSAGSGGLSEVMQQLAWEKDIDFTKGAGTPSQAKTPVNGQHNSKDARTLSPAHNRGLNLLGINNKTAPIGFAQQDQIPIRQFAALSSIRNMGRTMIGKMAAKRKPKTPSLPSSSAGSADSRQLATDAKSESQSSLNSANSLTVLISNSDEKKRDSSKKFTSEV